MYMKFLVSMLFAVGVVALATINTALAQSYPDKPIRLIVPYTAAGTTDIVARIIAEPLSQAIGQAVIVENKAGAGGAVGSAELARAAADGYTVGMATVSTMIIIPASNPKLNHHQHRRDPQRDCSECKFCSQRRQRLHYFAQGQSG
jgi:tripartite-type tricarboxylate transporter receptor subunit TctC